MAIATQPSNVVLPPLVTLGQYVLAAAGSVLVGKGTVTADQANVALGAIMTIVPALYGVFKSFKHAKAIDAAAPLVPDSIIQSK